MSVLAKKTPQYRAAGIAITMLLGLAACAPIQPVSSANVSATAEPTPAARATLATEMVADVVEDGAVPLTGPWRFSEVAQFTPEMAAPEFDDSAWETVDVPARWSEQGLGDLTGTGAVVVYRRTVDIPAAWEGAPVGISAWFYPWGTQVFVNGQKVEPARTPFAAYADIGNLVTPGMPAQIAVVAQYDGTYEATGMAPARIGLIGDREMTRVVREEGVIETADGEAAFVLTHPDANAALPGVLLVASGSHGLAELSAWRDVADELARAGYVSLAVALPAQDAAGVVAALDALRANPLVDPERVAIWGVDAAATAALEAAASTPVQGVIAFAPPMWNRLPATGEQPTLLLATEGQRGGLVLNQLKKLAEPVGERASVAALPGEGQGMFVITNVWNSVRAAVLPWLDAHLNE